MEKGKVSSYVSKKGKQVRGHVRIRRKKKQRSFTDKAKDYTAKAVLATAAYQTFGEPAVNATRAIQSKITGKIPVKFDVAKKAPLLKKFLPVGIAAYAGVRLGGKAIGWSLDRDRKRKKEKLRSKI
jgi:hypothetical protein